MGMDVGCARCRIAHQRNDIAAFEYTVARTVGYSLGEAWRIGLSCSFLRRAQIENGGEAERGKLPRSFGRQFAGMAAAQQHPAAHTPSVHGAIAAEVTQIARPRDGQQACVRRHHPIRSEEHTSELQSLMRNSSAVFCSITTT